MNIGLLALSSSAGEEKLKSFWNLCTYLIDNLGVSGTDTAGAITVICVFLCIIIPYLLGSINPAIIFSKLFYHDDIRSHGSGNAGATNTLRTYGKKMAIIIFAYDMLKAAIAVLFGYLIMPNTLGASIAGLFVILGHMFPIYYKFKGGKGVSCACMVVLLLSPISFLILIPLFIAIVLMTRYVSLGSIMAIMLFPLLNNAFYPLNPDVTLSAIVIMCFVVFMHRGNIKKLLEGKESKISFKKTEKHDADNSDGEKDNK